MLAFLRIVHPYQHSIIAVVRNAFKMRLIRQVPGSRRRRLSRAAPMGWCVDLLVYTPLG